MQRAGLTIFSSLAPETSDPSLDRLMHPGRFFTSPQDVLRDGTLAVQEKRAILSSWASDACAVESMPALRKLPGSAEPITFDAIMDALQQLDAIRPCPIRNSAGGQGHAGPERLDA